MSFTREETDRFYQRSTLRGLSLFAIDLSLLLGATYLTLWLPYWYLQLLGSALMGTIVAMLFVIGHDAAHDALTPHRWLNRLLGTIAFLPSLHPYSLWVKLHNLRHHHWTNLAGKDDVWVPLDLQQYQALSPLGRGLYRFYRGPYGSLLYYLIEFWWKKFTWPTKKHYDGLVKREYVVDTLIVWAFVFSYLGLLGLGAEQGWFGQPKPWWNAVLFGAVLPFVIWNVYSGLSIYLHHTHPRVIWYRDEEEWKRVSKANTAVHAVFPSLVQRVFHFIQEHSVHHLRPSVPIYHLAEAQECLEQKEDVDVVIYQWTLAQHMNIARRCKLYDFEAKRWMDFAGNYTSPPASKRRLASPLSPDVMDATEVLVPEA